MKKLGFLLAFAFSATSASATPIELYFRGVIQNTPTDNIILQRPDGTQYAYQGSNAPTYTWKAGDTFKVAFSIDSNFDPANPSGTTENGYYRIPVRGPGSSDAGPGATVNYVNLGGGGRGHAEGANGASVDISGFDLMYDPGSGSYSLDFKPGGYNFGGVWMPGYTYDPVADIFTPASCSPDHHACPAGTGQGTESSLLLSGIPIYSPDGEKIGTMDPLKVNGAFELPTWREGSQVPAPPMVALFAAGLAILGLRAGRRRRAVRLEPAFA